MQIPLYMPFGMYNFLLMLLPKPMHMRLHMLRRMSLYTLFGIHITLFISLYMRLIMPLFTQLCIHILLFILFNMHIPLIMSLLIPLGMHMSLMMLFCCLSLLVPFRAHTNTYATVHVIVYSWNLTILECTLKYTLIMLTLNIATYEMHF